MRFGFVIDRWQPTRGGAERALAQLAAHLATRGHEVLAFALAGPRDGEATAARFVPVVTAGLTRGARERRFAERALDAAAAAGCDATLAVRHVPRCDLYWPHGGAHGASLHALGKRARGRHRSFLALERAALTGGARRVVCVSELVRAEFAQAYPASVARLVVVPNGVELERFHPSARAAARARLDARLGGAHALRVGFLGRNARLKGLDTLLAAAVRLADPEVAFVAAGPRDAARWQARGRRAGLGRERWRVLADVPGLELTAGVDLLALPTRRDTGPLAVLEALACGTPAITTACAGEAASIEPEVGGAVLPDPEDVDALVQALRHWLARVRSGAIDPERVAASVKERGLDPWLARMERELLAMCGGPEVA